MITTLPLFNPAAPHADPIAGSPQSGPGAYQNGNRCGRCVSCPRFWKITSSTPPGADSLAAAMFGPSFVMTRALKAFEGQGTTAPVPPQTVVPIDQCEWQTQFTVPGGLGPGHVAGWQLYFGSLAGTLNFSGWIAIATGPTAQPLTEIAAYGINLSQWWECLKPNTLSLIPGQSAGFAAAPATVTVTPFWP